MAKREDITAWYRQTSAAQSRFPVRLDRLIPCKVAHFLNREFHRSSICAVGLSGSARPPMVQINEITTSSQAHAKMRCGSPIHR
jgi:hypothetical protein